MSAMTNNSQHPLGGKAALYEVDHNSKPAINTPEADISELHRIDLKLKQQLEDRSDDCAEELLAGLDAIAEYPKTVTIFGSARLQDGSPYYEHARRLAGKIAKDGFAVLTGGGPGIMEAANRGATETVGYSIGFNINLPFEQVINPYVTHGLDFDFFSARKMAMFFSAEAYIYFPGGFGTFDEFFQLVTLIQTKKVPPTPVICYGKEFWQPLDTVIRTKLLEEFGTISPADRTIYTITDDDDEILRIVNSAPLRTEYDGL